MLEPSHHVLFFSLTCKKLFHTKAEGIYHYISHALSLHRISLTTAFDPNDPDYQTTLTEVESFIKKAEQTLLTYVLFRDLQKYVEQDHHANMPAEPLLDRNDGDKRHTENEMAWE